MNYLDQILSYLIEKRKLSEQEAKELINFVMVSIDILKAEERTKENVLKKINRVLTMDAYKSIADEECIDLLFKFVNSEISIKSKEGKAVTKNWIKWLDDYKKTENYKPFYWPSLEKFLKIENKNIPRSKINILNIDTDKIVELLGNPNLTGQWKRKGMVMGSVQSGKTLNYTTVISKASDVGYKLIVLMTSSNKKLRSQTQERIDEQFVGKFSLGSGIGSQDTFTGVSHHRNKNAEGKTPITLTTVKRDFNKPYPDITSDSIRSPLIFVVQKNSRVLGNLIDFFEKDTPEFKERETLLLIDDEADNASINTKAQKEDITKINQSIRGLLRLFKKSSYLAYTATPFANIFILPDSTDEWIGDDLFPEDYIYALDNDPEDYFGPRKIFSFEKEKYSHCLEIIDDHVGVFPEKAKDKKEIPFLPKSLKEAILSFIIIRCIFIILGKAKDHCTMMINISYLNILQNDLYALVEDYLDEIKDEIELKSSMYNSEKSSLVISTIKNIFEDKFLIYSNDNEEIKWKNILINLHDAISSIVLEISKAGSQALDYKRNEENGLHVIVIGGYTLSRGLTLENLTVSYMVRTTKAYDTLLQMGRWFGYREPFAKYCKIYLTQETRNHFNRIRYAVDELYEEVNFMNETDRTPKDFGLKVRNHEQSKLRITAKNKMSGAETIRIAADFSDRFLQAFKILNSNKVNSKNRNLVKNFIKNINSYSIKNSEGINFSKKDIFWVNVSVEDVLRLLDEFYFPENLVDFSDYISENKKSQIYDYIDYRKNELSDWQVFIPSNIDGDESNIEKEIIENLDFYAPKRGEKSEDVGYIEDNGRVFSPTKRRTLNRPGAKNKGRVKENDKYIRMTPLLIINIQSWQDNTMKTDFNKNYVSLSIDFPPLTKDSKPPKEKIYSVNKTFLELMLENNGDNEWEEENE